MSESDYSVFGLRVRSRVPLPELFAADGEGEPDVTIALGAVPEADGVQPGLWPMDGALLLVVRDVGRYRIEAGRRIIIEPQPEVPERNVRLFLLGSAFGALLHQRGLLPLHANAVEIDRSAVAFMGPSGAGKSTLAAWFHDQGYRVIADDVCVIGFDDQGRPFAAPGLPRLRLWAEALELMGRGTEGFQRSYIAAAEQLEKFDVPIDTNSAAVKQIELSALYLLEQSESYSVERLRGIDAAEAIFANTYRGMFVVTAGGQQSHWQSVVRLVETIPVFRASRLWNLADLDSQSRALLEHAGGVIAAEDG
jgi:hypothetical protein